jgi:hypothetical protein
MLPNNYKLLNRMETNKMNEVITFKSVEEFENWITNEWAVLIRSKYLKAMEAIMAQPEMKGYNRYLKKGANIPDKLSKDFQITWNCEKKNWNEELHDWVKTPMTDGELIRWDNRNEDEMYSSGFYFEEVTNSTRYHMGEDKPIILNKGNLFLYNLTIETPTVRLELAEGSREFKMPMPSYISGVSAFAFYNEEWFVNRDKGTIFVGGVTTKLVKDTANSIYKKYYEKEAKVLVDKIVEKIMNMDEVAMMIDKCGEIMQEHGCYSDFIDERTYGVSHLLNALKSEIGDKAHEIYMNTDGSCHHNDKKYRFLRA